MQDRRTVPPAAPTGPVACLGEALALVDPVTGVDAGGVPVPRRAALAGAEANVAVALAAAGVPVQWVGRLGADGLGSHLAAELGRRGVRLDGVEIDPSLPTGWYSKIVRRVAGGEPQTEMRYRRAGSAAAAMEPAFLDRTDTAAVLAQAAVVHTSGITAALSPACAAMMRALLMGPRRGGLVSFDVNWREQLWPDGDPAEVVALAGAADVVMVGADEARRVFGTDDPAELRALLPSPQLLVIKDGHVQARGVDRNGSVVDVPALSVEVVEAVGAGDAFAAGLLFGVMVGEPVEQALRRGHLSAARVLTVHSDSAPPFPAGVLNAMLTCTEQEWAQTRVSAAGVRSPAVSN